MRGRARWTVASFVAASALACRANDAAPSAPRAPRVAVRAGATAVRELSSLSYRGGFEPKTLVYETLVTRDGEGRIVGALAESWRIEDEGRAFVFVLRDGARWHDGSPVHAEDVCDHVRRWAGLREHDWLPANRRIVRIEARSERELAIVLDRPHALLASLCAYNPGGIRGPATLDAEGVFVSPVGSGGFAWRAPSDDGRVLRYVRASDGDPLALVRYEEEPVERMLEDLRSNGVDAVVDASSVRIPRATLREFAADPVYEVLESRGSSVVMLGFCLEKGPCSDPRLRARVRASISRARLVAVVEDGFADACWTFAPPFSAGWPECEDPFPVAPRESTTTFAPLRLVVRSGDPVEPALARELAAQIERSGVQVIVLAAGAGEYAEAMRTGDFDLRIERTWGYPYDPELSLHQRFARRGDERSVAAPVDYGRDDRIAALVEDAFAEVDEEKRSVLHARIQREIDSRALLVPLYAPRRAAIVRRGTIGLSIGPDAHRFDARPLRRAQ